MILFFGVVIVDLSEPPALPSRYQNIPQAAKPLRNIELWWLQDTFENPFESAELTREPKDNIGENPSAHGNKEDFTSRVYATGKRAEGKKLDDSSSHCSRAVSILFASAAQRRAVR